MEKQVVATDKWHFLYGKSEQLQPILGPFKMLKWRKENMHFFPKLSVRTVNIRRGELKERLVSQTTNP